MHTCQHHSYCLPQPPLHAPVCCGSPHVSYRTRASKYAYTHSLSRSPSLSFSLSLSPLLCLSRARALMGSWEGQPCSSTPSSPSMRTNPRRQRKPRLRQRPVRPWTISTGLRYRSLLVSLAAVLLSSEKCESLCRMPGKNIRASACTQHKTHTLLLLPGRSLLKLLPRTAS